MFVRSVFTPATVTWTTLGQSAFRRTAYICSTSHIIHLDDIDKVVLSPADYHNKVSGFFFKVHVGILIREVFSSPLCHELHDGRTSCYVFDALC